jgi:hypothetical protein
MIAMGFSFTATAKCDHCGQLLGSSDENCDHDGKSVKAHVFRRLGEGWESLTGVEAIVTYKWYKLAEEIGEDWIAYEYLGTKSHVNSMLEGSMWDDVEDLPKISMSVDAPSDVREEVFDE